MKKSSKIICFIFFFLPILLFSQTQDKKSLQNKFDKLQNEIKDAEDLLQETQQDKKESLSELKLLNRKIDVREQMIDNISDQMGVINSEMKETINIIGSMEGDLKQLKNEYAKMIYTAYINQTDYEPLHFIFSSKSIGDAFREIQYIKEYNSFRKEQIGAIKAIQSELEEKLGFIQSSKAEKAKLLTQEETEKQKLASEKQKKDKSVETLKTKEKEIKGQIAKKKTDAQKLNTQIQNIIAAEIKKEKERAEAEAAKKKKDAEKNTTAEKTTEKKSETKTTTTEKKTETKTENLGLTPEMQLISQNFAGNKGRLPWPVERGTITGKFGKQPHPVLKDVITENNGIDITTGNGSVVRSIFEGEVVNIIFNPSFQKGVIIKHGEYYSVYTNLTSVSVKPGDKVKVKQQVGVVFFDPDEGKSEVHLEIWKGETLLDPSLWISKQ